jgi:hypothetical protein
MNDHIFVRHLGQTSGPFPHAQLKSLVESPSWSSEHRWSSDGFNWHQGISTLEAQCDLRQVELASASPIPIPTEGGARALDLSQDSTSLETSPGKKSVMNTILVPNQKDLEMTINSYVAQGYLVSNKSTDTAVLTKKKQFSIPIGIVGFLCCVIGLIIYCIVYEMQSDKIVAIRVR